MLLGEWEELTVSKVVDAAVVVVDVDVDVDAAVVEAAPCVPEGDAVPARYPYTPSPPQMSDGKPGHGVLQSDVSTWTPGT